MKLTPILEETLKELKENLVLHKMEHWYGTPHVFGPVSQATKKPLNHVIDGRRIYLFPNRQSLNKLVMLGYAEYQDKAKTIIRYIDKDAAEEELKRKAAIYDRVMSIKGSPLFEDETGLDLLGLSKEELLDLDQEELQLMYDNLLSMIYGALAHIEELEELEEKK